MGLVVAALGIALTAGPAAAAGNPTTLCNISENPCPSANQYAANTPFTGALVTGTSAELTNSLDDFTCNNSTVALQNTAQTGTPLPGEVTGLTFTNCADALNNSCTITTSGFPYDASISADGLGDGGGVLTLKKLSAHLVCSFYVNCTFTAASTGISGTITGGNPATVTFTNAPLSHSGGYFCPSTASLTATYDTNGTNAAVWPETPASS